MTTAKEAGFIPSDLVVYASALKRQASGGSVGVPLNEPSAEVKLAVGRIQALNVPGSHNPNTPVTRVRVLWTNGEIFDRGRTVEIDAQFSNFVTDDDKRLQRELAGAKLPFLIQRTTDENGETRVDLGALKEQALKESARWHDVEVPEEEIKKALLEEGGVERLIDAGRTPQFRDFQQGRKFPEQGLKDMTFCMIPPHGTKPEDQIIRYEGGIYEVTSPTGEIRGKIKFVTLTRAEGIEMQLRVYEAIQKKQTK